MLLKLGLQLRVNKTLYSLHNHSDVRNASVMTPQESLKRRLHVHSHAWAHWHLACPITGGQGPPSSL